MNRMQEENLAERLLKKTAKKIQSGYRGNLEGNESEVTAVTSTLKRSKKPLNKGFRTLLEMCKKY